MDLKKKGEGEREREREKKTLRAHPDIPAYMPQNINLRRSRKCTYR